MQNKLYIVFTILILTVANCFATPPEKPYIITPSGTGSTYNTKPWIFFMAQDTADSINQVQLKIYNSIACDAGSLVYSRDSIDVPSQFYPLPTTANVETSVRHRVQIALTPGTYWIKVSVKNTNTGGRQVPNDRVWVDSDPRQMIIVTAPTWTDSTITPGTTRIKAVHFNEIKTAIDELRSFRGSGVYGWSTFSVGGLIRAGYMTELRTALTTPYNAATGSNPTFTDSSITPGTTLIRADHINELRSFILRP